MRIVCWQSAGLFCRKLGKMSQNWSSVAVVIGALRVNTFILNGIFYYSILIVRVGHFGPPPN